MKRFKSILVVCQPDSQPELAIERARLLATQNGARVTLVDVVSLPESDLEAAMSDPSGRTPHEMKRQLSEYHQARLDEHQQMLASLGIETSTQVFWGVAFVEIIRAVLRDGHDLVIKAINPNQTFRGQQVFGSLDMHLMRKCPSPIWILKDPIERENLHVLAAVDPDQSDGEQEGLNRLIMDLSTSMIPSNNCLVHVVHTWALSEEWALLNSRQANSSKDTTVQIEETLRESRAQALDRLTAHYPVEDKNLQIHLLHGDAGEIVPELTAKFDIDVVVMGTVRRVDLSGMFMGNTAEVILNRLSCSVLAVKPHDFRSPIELGESVEKHDRSFRGRHRAGQVA